VGESEVSPRRGGAAYKKGRAPGLTSGAASVRQHTWRVRTGRSDDDSLVGPTRTGSPFPARRRRTATGFGSMHVIFVLVFAFAPTFLHGSQA
jgi:hypothetical protein